jgi:signal transduction histidine kinase
VEQKRNRQLLYEWLSMRYTVVEMVPPVKLSDEFDLVILDGLALDRLWLDIQDRKAADVPVFLPVLFLTNLQDLRMVTRHLWKAVDELLSIPIEKIELLARVEVLMRARRLSLELREANRIKTNFLAMISHELRTPLTSIKGFSSTIIADDVVWSTDEVRDFVTSIDIESEKMTELVEHLLDLSRLQSGTFSIHPEICQFQRILADARDEIFALTGQHPLLESVPDALPEVYVDSRRIGQVLVNLIGNAAKFAPSDTPIQVNVIHSNGYVRVDVIDQGPGIQPQDWDIVFEAFQQSDKSTNKKGAGLGLAICKGIVEAHGGKIWIADTGSVGTHICFTVPTHETAMEAV